MKFNSIRFKISVLYIALLGIVLIVYSAFLYTSLHYTLYDELDNELRIKSEETAKVIDSYREAFGADQQALADAAKKAVLFDDNNINRAAEEIKNQWMQKIDKFDLREDYIDFINTGWNSIVRSSNFQGPMFYLSAAERRRLKSGIPVFKNIKIDRRSMRLINMPFFCADGGYYVIQIATSLKPIIHLLQLRLLHIAFNIPIILALASFMGSLFASRILKPVVEITRTASNITHEDLSARVKAEHVDEEMKYLVDAFNDMISRLEVSFGYIADFSSQVSHELKTPLAIIKGESEIALRKDRSPEEYKRAIRVILEEVERMLKVTEDLLLLTKLDYRPEFFKFEKLDLIDFLSDIYEQSKILVSQKDMIITADIAQAKIYVKADKLHLRRLFFSLIDNAIKFNRKNGKISITVKSDGKNVFVSVSDSGPGILDQDLPRIFDKFFHADRSAHDSIRGTGLGLSIAQSIAKIHQGKISVKTSPGAGTIFTVTMPLL